MKITDYNKIESITPKYPELMHECAPALALEEFRQWKECESSLNKMRSSLIALEQKNEQLKKSFKAVSEFFDIVYAEVEKDVLPTDNSQTGDVINRLRNQH